MYFLCVCDVIVELASKGQAANVYCYPVDIAEELKQSDCSSSQSSLATDSVLVSSVTDGLQSGMAETDPSCDSDDSAAMESFDDFEGFCIIDEPGLGIMVSADLLWHTDKGVRGLEPLPLAYDLRNKHQNASKYGIFNKKYKKNFWEGHSPLPRPPVGGGYPLSHASSPLGVCGTSTPPILKSWERHCKLNLLHI